MAEISTSVKDYDKAINCYKEGLSYDETHIPVSMKDTQYTDVK